MMVSGLLALALAAAFAGAAIYIHLAEQPARLGLDDRNLLKQWKPSYAGGFRMQGTLAVASAACGVLAAWLSGDLRWLIGATLVAANWPYTMFAMMPTNGRLNAVAEDAADGATRAMILGWGRLHAVRSGLGLAATAAYVWVLSGPTP